MKTGISPSYTAILVEVDPGLIASMKWLWCIYYIFTVLLPGTLEAPRKWCCSNRALIQKWGGRIPILLPSYAFGGSSYIKLNGPLSTP